MLCCAFLLSEIFIATWTKFLRCTAVCIFYNSNRCHYGVAYLVYLHGEAQEWDQSGPVGGRWSKLRTSNKVGWVFFPLTRVFTKLKLMAWFNNPLAMTTCSLFSPSEMLFAREWTGGRLSQLVLMLSCCHAHCMSESLFNSPLCCCQTSLWFLQGRKWGSAACATVHVTLPRSRKNKQLGKFWEHYRPLNVHSPTGSILYAAPKLRLWYFYPLACLFLYNIYPQCHYMDH